MRSLPEPAANEAVDADAVDAATAGTKLRARMLQIRGLGMRKKEPHHLGAGVGAAGIGVRSARAAAGPCMRCTVDDPILRFDAVGGRQPPPRACAPPCLAVQLFGDG